MNKMQMAHEYAMQLSKNPSVTATQNDKDIASRAWEYADAMQAEAEERKDKTRPKALLTKDKDGKCLYFNHEFGHKKCMDCGASLEEWQPDWSQAPEWAKYWHYNSYHSAYWVDAKPEDRGDTAWSFDFLNKRAAESPSFGYQGNWQDSLRKRPEALCEVDWSAAPKNAFQWQMINNEAYWRIEIMGGMDTEPAPSFGFTGNHIAERPQ